MRLSLHEGFANIINQLLNILLHVDQNGTYSMVRHN